MKQKKCSTCNKIKNIVEFYPRKESSDGYRPCCKECDSNTNKKRSTNRRKIYRKLIHKLKINGCAICGYSKCDRALDFHHVNPQDKEFQVAQAAFNRKNNSITKELNKCILLCKNCHAEIEQKERGNRNEDTVHPQTK